VVPRHHVARAALDEPQIYLQMVAGRERSPEVGDGAAIEVDVDVPAKLAGARIDQGPRRLLLQMAEDVGQEARPVV
jgi:hypothetical protein